MKMLFGTTFGFRREAVAEAAGEKPCQKKPLVWSVTAICSVICMHTEPLRSSRRFGDTSIMLVDCNSTPIIFDDITIQISYDMRGFSDKPV